MAFGGSTFGASCFGGGSSTVPQLAMSGEVSIGSIEMQGALSVRMDLAGSIEIPSVSLAGQLFATRRSQSAGRVVSVTSSGRLVDAGNF